MAESRSTSRAKKLHPFAETRRPLACLIFLAPIVLAHEIGAVLYLSGDSGEVAQTIQARRLIADFIELFGVVGLYAPGLVILAVLLIQHIVSRQRWRVAPATIGVMTLESILRTAPLLVLAAVLLSMKAAAQTAGIEAEAVELASLPLGARFTIALGAGLYEEALFRFALVTLAHLILADLLRVRSDIAAIISVVLAAVVFTGYHNVDAESGAAAARVSFLFLAGVFLGALYLLRGLGVAVGAHAMYDIVVLVIMPELNSS